MALDKIDSKKHSGVISEFRRLYIKTGLLSRELSETIDNLVEVRQGSDYNDFYVISKEEVAEQLANARIFVSEADQYLISVYTVNE